MSGLSHSRGGTHSHGAHEQGGHGDHGLGAHSHEEHGHTHGTIDPTILTTGRGIRAVKWSFVVLFATTLIQITIFYFSNSVALLADTIHNLGDACTAIPLGIAFLFARKKSTKRFTYGYGRIEDF